MPFYNKPWSLPGDRQPGGDDKMNCRTATKAASKSWRWVAFLSGRPWFAWRQGQPEDDDERKPTPRRIKKAGAGLPFYKAGPGLPGDRQPGGGLEQPPCLDTPCNGDTPHSGSRPPARLVAGTARADWRVTRPVRMTWMDPGVPPCPVIGIPIAKRPRRVV